MARSTYKITHVMEILASARTPLAVGDILEELSKKGLVDVKNFPTKIKKKDPREVARHHLYTRILMEMKKADSPIVRTGRGYFSLQEFADKEPLAARDLVSGSRCGNCKFIEFDGPHELSLVFGTCGRYDQSGRVGVTCKQGACPLWQKRTSDQLHKDRSRQLELITIVKAVNESVQRSAARRDSTY